MGNRICLILIITVLITGFSCNSELDDTVELNTKGEVEMLSVNSELFGQSASHMFEVNPTPSELLVEKVKKLDVPFLRFPGGTESNYYHFFGKGNGLKKEDIDLSIGKASHPKLMIRLKKEEAHIQEGRVLQNYAHTFAKFAKQVGTDVVLVLNLFSATDDENIALINFFLEKGIKVRGVELGNENYFKAYNTIFPDAKEYILRSKKLNQKIKKLYSEIPVAVTAANPPFDSPLSLRSRFDDWNREIAKEDFYDAIVVHFYAKTKECDDLETIEDKFNCAFPLALEKSKTMLSEGFKYYNEVFGSETKIWITEYNVKKVFKHYGNSALQALYNANFFMEILKEPKVEKAIYHNLYSNSFGYAMLSRKKQDVLERLPYYVFKMFSEIDKNAFVLKGVELSENSAINTIVFHSSDEDNYQCFIANTGNTSETLDFSDYIDDTNVQLRGFYAENLMSSIGTNAVRNDENWNDIHFIDRTTNTKSIEIAPFSFTNFIFQK